MEERVRKAVVVGAGPVGCLAAMALAKSGWEVDIYEGRPDLRLPSSKALSQQRSINLAISSRGLAALHVVDPAATERFLQTVIPMRGRMIHDSKGRLDSQPYDKDGQCINSIDRALLNEGLLDEATSVRNVRTHFRHKVESLDFDQRSMVVRDLDTGEDHEITFDLCVGADGSFSVVRRQLMRVVRMDYTQVFIPHEYLELKIPAGQDDSGNTSFLLDPNHLHIWPRHSFMLIALPNKDKSFTCTLFAPTVEFDRLGSPEETVVWFESNFADAYALIGEEALRTVFEHNPRSPLISIKLKPYHYKDRVILLGDAAHSMVPFYGQGLNCGLEDVRVLDVLLRTEGLTGSVANPGPKTKDYVDDHLATVLSRYSESRHDDLVAICDLAMDNYREMRHDVTTVGYIFRKTLDNILFALSSGRQISLASLGAVLSQATFTSPEPGGWLPLYTMVTFRPDISYSTARKKAAVQTRVLNMVGWVGSAVTVTIAGIALSQRLRRLA